MKYTFLLLTLLLLSVGCSKTPVEQEKEQARLLCKNIAGFLYNNDYKADKCAILDFIKKEVTENFNEKTYYASVELVKGVPVAAVPCPEKLMTKDTALKGRFKPLSERAINDKYEVVYYIEHDEKVDAMERKVRVKLADRGERYVINVEILTE